MKRFLNFIKEKIEYVENQNITFGNIITSVFIAIFIRNFFEGFLSQYTNGKILNFVDYFFHYPLWYIGIFLIGCIVLVLVIKEDIIKVSKFFVYAPFVILLPPIIDFFINKGNLISYSYISGGFFDLFNFLIRFGSYKNIETTIGIRIEIIIVLVLIGLFLYIKTNNFKKVFLGIFLFYISLFLFAITPTSIFYFYNLIDNNDNEVNVNNISDFYEYNFLKSDIANEKTYIFSFNKQKNIFIQEKENHYSIFMSFFFLFVDIILLAWFFWLYSRTKFIATIKNFRYLRVISYFLMIFFGIYLGLLISNKEIFISLFDLFSILNIFISLFFAGLFCIWQNDQIDLDIDKISNPKRPLPLKIFELKEWNNIKYIFLFIALISSFLNGFYSFLLIIMFLINYNIYSTPPLRLKRLPIISSFLVSFNVLVVVWLGFFVSSGIEQLNKFPLKYLIFILVSVFFIENIKNIKDIEGDKKNRIKTIPNIIGEEKSKIIFGFILAIFCLTVPFVFYLSLKTLIISIIFAVIMFLFMNKKIFEEKYIFITYFTFILFFILSILL